MSSLSNVLLNNNNKVAILSQFKKDLVFLDTISNKVFNLYDLKQTDKYKNFNISISDSDLVVKNFLVVYIISISFLKANTMIHVSDIKGNVKLFYTSGSVKLVGKQKRRRILAVLRLLKLIYKNASFLYGKPIALHLNNVNRHKFLIVRKLKQKFFIKVIREFNQTPYNGCRKPKVRRKKYRKGFM